MLDKFKNQLILTTEVCSSGQLQIILTTSIEERMNESHEYRSSNHIFVKDCVSAI